MQNVKFTVSKNVITLPEAEGVEKFVIEATEFAWDFRVDYNTQKEAEYNPGTKVTVDANAIKQVEISVIIDGKKVFLRRVKITEPWTGIFDENYVSSKQFKKQVTENTLPKAFVPKQVEGEVSVDRENTKTGLIFDGMTSSEAIASDENPFNEGVSIKEEDGAVYISNRVSDENKHEIRKPSVTFSAVELYDSEDEESSEITELLAKYFSAEMVGIVNAYHYRLALEELEDALIDIEDGTLTLPNLYNIVYIVNGDTVFPSAMEPSQEHDYEYGLNGGDIYVDVYIENSYHDEDVDPDPVATIEIYGGVREATYTVREFLNKK